MHNPFETREIWFLTGSQGLYGPETLEQVATQSREIAETLGARERMARSLLTDTLWRVGLMAVAALLLVWLAVSAALRPLGRLSEAVQERAPDDLRPLPLVSVQRELRPLVVALNGFTERLRGQFERQARFIADASHELRTPLAALKARIELGLRDADPAAWRSTLEDAGQSTDKVIHLANQLLSLARIESGAQSIAEGGAQRPHPVQRQVDDLGVQRHQAVEDGVGMAHGGKKPGASPRTPGIFAVQSRRQGCA